MYADEILKKRGGLFSVKVELNKAFSKESEPDAWQMMTQDNGDSHWILLREYSSGEMMEFQGMDEHNVTAELEKKIPDFIVDHSFVKSDLKKASNSEVQSIIRMSSSLFVYVLEVWQKSLPLVRRTQAG